MTKRITRPPKKTGRPTVFKTEYIEQAGVLCTEFGADDNGLAKFFKVTVGTIKNWKKEYPEFLSAIKEGKDDYDSKGVEGNLLRRANGYDYEEVQTEVRKDSSGAEVQKAVVKKVKRHVPPDVVAMIFWLKNRQPGRWRDKQEIENSIKVKEVPELVINIEK